MADFRLTDEGEVELRQLGEDTSADLWDHCFAALRDVLSDQSLYDESGEFTKSGRRRLREAVENERKRHAENQPADEPSTELGRQYVIWTWPREHEGNYDFAMDEHDDAESRQRESFYAQQRRTGCPRRWPKPHPERSCPMISTAGKPRRWHVLDASCGSAAN
ncbi:MAG: hypothetical protein HY820_38385 [Acidobacteria bacterium]|nr:hypothetical protein [Acidobacteriota bacterium]